MSVKIGLMLSGGGAKGAYQLGVIHALFESGLIHDVKVISGVSIGAINTIMLMAGKTYEEMREIWNELDQKAVFSTPNNLLNKPKSLFSVAPLAETLIAKIPLEKVRKSRYQGYATAALMYSKEAMKHQVDTDSMEKVVFHLNTFKNPYDAVLASASIPVIFGPTTIDGFNYVDGGILDNDPIQPLIDAGCNLIFAIPLDYKFNPHLYDHLPITIVDFTASSAFEKDAINYFIDMVKFNNKFKDMKENFGYLVGRMMIQKIYDEKLITHFLWIKNYNVKNEFNLIRSSTEVEQALKDMKKTFKKSKGKTQ